MSYIPNKPMTKNLEEYVKTDGQWFPSNYDEYQTPGILDQLCPLCHEYHGNYKEFLFGPDGGQVRANMCEECAFEVSLSESVRNVYRPDTVIHQINARIRRYKSLGVLPIDADRYVMKPNICLFCRSEVDSSNFMAIDLPVDSEAHCNGGQVSCCSTCADILDWQQYHLDTSDCCPRCDSLYPISEREAEIRVIKNTSGKHLCPSCFQQVHGTLLQERFVTIPCNCERSQMVDLFTIWEQNPKPKAGFLCNHECRLALPAHAHELALYHNIDDTHRIMIYKKNLEDKHWISEYQIKRVNEKIWDIRRCKSYEDAMDASDVLWQELTYISSLPGIQLKFNM